MWQDVRFVINRPSEPCDILVVLNGFYERVDVECRETWQIVQEPPIDVFPWIFKKQKSFDKVFSPGCSSKDRNCIPSHGALPWHIDMSYDELKRLRPPEKTKYLSAVISNKSVFPGHKKRIAFVNGLGVAGISTDLYGHGFNPIKNKYDGIAEYRYSLAIENFSGRHYWTEKIADCFLSWTIPIYYGCTNLADYFPRESFFQIDIDDPHVFQQIKEIIKDDHYAKRREALEEARNLVLDRYQLFPFLVNEVRKSMPGKEPRKRTYYPYKENILSKIQSKIQNHLKTFRA
jgi:hypothetical protein